MLRYLTFLLAALSPAFATAQVSTIEKMPAGPTADAKSCAALSDDSARLECFDLLYRKEVLAAPGRDKGDWQLVEERSKIDDSRTVALVAESRAPRPARFGADVHYQLTLRCLENTTSAIVWFGGNFMSDVRGGGRVTYRVDDREAATVEMQPSTDNDALGLWRGAVAIPFIQSLFGGSNLYLRAIPFSESMVDAEFAIGGLEEAIAPLRQTCGW